MLSGTLYLEALPINGSDGAGALEGEPGRLVVAHDLKGQAQGGRFHRVLVVRPSRPLRPLYDRLVLLQHCVQLKFKEVIII